jgi:hypothetical protein
MVDFLDSCSEESVGDHQCDLLGDSEESEGDLACDMLAEVDEDKPGAVSQVPRAAEAWQRKPLPAGVQGQRKHGNAITRKLWSMAMSLQKSRKKLCRLRRSPGKSLAIPVKVMDRNRLRLVFFFSSCFASHDHGMMGSCMPTMTGWGPRRGNAGRGPGGGGTTASC